MPNGYRLNIPSGSNSISLVKLINGSVQSPPLASYTYTGPLDASAVRLRIQAIGSALNVRLWPAGSLEPTTWSLQATDTAFTYGTLQLAHAHTTTDAVRSLLLDDLTYSDQTFDSEAIAGDTPFNGPSDIKPVLAQAQNVFGSQYAGAWYALDSSGINRLNIGAVTPTQSQISDLTARVNGAAWLTVIPASYSWTQLNQYYNSVASVLNQHGPAAGSVLSIQPEINKVRLEITPSDATQLGPYLQGAVPANSLVIVQDQTEITPDAGASRQDYPPLRAGSSIRTSNNGSFGKCTAAFTMVLDPGFWGSSAGTNVGTTAGHCAQALYDHVYAGLNQSFDMGRITWDSYLSGGMGDHALIAFNTDQQTSAGTNALFVKKDLIRNVVDEFTNDELVVGTPISKSGSRTGTTAGKVTTSYPTQVTYSYKDRNGSQHVQVVHNLICADYYGQPGDSGAPVYQRLADSPQPTAKAAGVHVAAHFTNGKQDASCFDPIQEIEQETVSHVRKN